MFSFTAGKLWSTPRLGARKFSTRIGLPDSVLERVGQGWFRKNSPKALGEFSAVTILDVIESTQQVGVGAAIGRPSARIRSIQRWSVALLIAGGALNYVDRATLAVANKLIQDDLGIPVARMGLLISAFLWAYAIAQLPVGGLIDRFGPRRLLGLGLV